MENNNFNNPQFPQQPQQPQYQQPQYQQPQYQQAPQYQQPQPQYQQAPQQPQYQQAAPQYGAPQGFYGAPPAQLKTDRSLVKYILFSIITCGIYGIIKYAEIPTDLNLIASRYDGKKTTSYWLMVFVLTPITCGIYAIIWAHGLCERIGNELQRRGIPFSFGAKDFWIFGVLLSFTVVCPFIYMSKLFKAMNLLSEDYNMKG